MKTPDHTPERLWITSPDARQRRSERAMYAIHDIVRALKNGKPAPENAERALRDTGNEAARASAWRLIHDTK